MQSSFDLSTFIDQLASGEPTPGGGSAAALAGATGAALTAMVARLTIGKKRYAEVEPQMQTIAARAETLRARLTALVQEDADAFNQVRDAFRLPKGTEEELAARAEAVQAGLTAATLTPLETARACVEVLELAEQVVADGNANASTDGGVGALLAHAGLQGAVWNVRVNLGSIADAAFVDDTRAAADQFLADGQRSLDRTRQILADR